MGFTFRRSFKLLPGVRVNVSKSGVSTTIGPKIAKVTVGAKRRATFSSDLPGPVNYRRTLGKSRRRSR